MKKFLALLLLSSSAITLAEEVDSRFIFPPFAQGDVTKLSHPFPRYPTNEELRSISVEELRGIMANGNAFDQRTVTKELLERGDQHTILRLIYSLREGNVMAIEMLNESTLAVIPYLMEDVAQGSLAYYGSYDFGDAFTSSGRVREAAVKRVASILFRASEFTDDTRECLRAIGRGNPDQIQGLSDESQYLIQWWRLNEEAFEAGKWEDTRPLPQEIIYGNPKNDTRFPRDESWDPKNQPPFGSPAWELSESFEDWSARIVDPKRRNLDFVALSWDGKKVVEHPARSLDPRTRPGNPQERESLKTPAPRNPPESGMGVEERKGLIWGTLAAVLLIVISIIRWMRLKSTTKA